MLKYLKKLLDEAKDLNIFIVISGRNPIALECYSPVNETFENLFQLIESQNNNKIKIIDCFSSFNKEDFVDLLHLNMNGAKKITEIINGNLKSTS